MIRYVHVKKNDMLEKEKRETIFNYNLMGRIFTVYHGIFGCDR